MRSFSWYLRRLESMSPGEVWWRCRCELRDAADRFLVPLRSRLRPLHRLVSVRPGEPATASHVLAPHLRRADRKCATGFPVCRSTDWKVGPTEEANRWQASLVAKADAIAEHRLDLFSLRDHHLGDQINWNYEHKARKRTPMRVASTIDLPSVVTSWPRNRRIAVVVFARKTRYERKTPSSPLNGR